MKVTGKKVTIAVIVVVIAAALVYANLRFRRAQGPAVTAEAVKARDLEAIVSASGKIKPKREVNITSEVSGRITRLAVEEGDRVKAGQFLLEIDRRLLASAVESGEASLQGQRVALQQARTQLEAAKENLALARQTLTRQQDLWKDLLVTRETVDRAENDVKNREAEVQTRTSEIAASEQRIRQMSANLDSARYQLSRVTIESPIDGIVTRRNVEAGETAVVGFTNNPSVVLLTIADMSVVEAEIEVDETDIPSVQIGQRVKVAIDAIPDKKFPGRVTEIGNSPIQTTGTTGTQQATNFRVVVTLEGQVPDVRPGFTCTAEITTATRSKALSVPIQAMAVRELVFDKAGKIVRPPKDNKRRPGGVETVASADTLPPDQTRKETEGVFIYRDGTAQFVPVKTGIAGDRYFEVLSGLKEGDRVITGPFASVRDLADGDNVKLEEKPQARGR
jgi:HlyD family secretion protein